jgi:Mor family transcriptional regulator
MADEVVNGVISKGRGWFRISEETRAGIIKDYDADVNVSICQLSEKYKVSWLGVRNILIKAGRQIRKNGTFMRRNAKLTPEIKKAIVDEYVAGMNSNELADKYDVAQSLISKIIKEAGVTRPNEIAHRKYACDESAFDTITEESAYWIGMMMTDGSVMYDKGRKRSPNVSLGLAKVDECHVVKFRTFLKSGHSLCNFMATSRSGELFPAVKLQIRSRRIAESLEKYGVGPKKLYRAKVVGLESDRHFWRGVVDGDGCIHIRKDYGYPSISVCGTQGLLEQFREYVVSVTPGCDATVRPAGESKAFQIALVGSHAEVMIDRLYSNCTVALDRKLEAAKKIIRLSSPVVQSAPITNEL